MVWEREFATQGLMINLSLAALFDTAKMPTASFQSTWSIGVILTEPILSHSSPSLSNSAREQWMRAGGSFGQSPGGFLRNSGLAKACLSIGSK